MVLLLLLLPFFSSLSYFSTVTSGLKSIERDFQRENSLTVTVVQKIGTINKINNSLKQFLQ